jgi:ribosomal protein S27AE
MANYRNRKLLEAVRDAPCMSCGSKNGTVVAAHSNRLADGKGRGMKAHDYRIAALCFHCHTAYDQGGEMGRAQKAEFFEHAHRKTIGWLFENDILQVRK